MLGGACERAGPPAAPPLRPIPDTSGAIRRIVIHAPSAYIPAIADPLRDLAVALPGDVEMIVACDTADARQAIVDLLADIEPRPRPRLRLVDGPTPGSLWARDRYIACAPPHRAGATLLVPTPPHQPIDERRHRDLDLAERLARDLLDTEPRHVGVRLEGGNLIATDSHVFIGGSVLLDNARDRLASETRALLDELFALPVVLVQDAAGGQPFDHIDMFLMALSDGDLIVASPALGASTLEACTESERTAVSQLLHGEPDLSERRAAEFDAIARALAEQGFRIARLPYLDNRGGDFQITYNNVVQDHRNGDTTVYMPVYGVDCLDDAAAAVYESLGRRVVRVRSAGLCRLGGAVRCVANVVERGPTIGSAAGSVSQPTGIR